MAATILASHGVMEGGGSYNLHAKVPAGGANLALPLLEEAVGHITLEPDDLPIVVADYGSSQGKNSLAPMRTAIHGLRKRVGAERPIFVVHIDQSANDFNTLVGVLHADPECFVVDDADGARFWLFSARRSLRPYSLLDSAPIASPHCGGVRVMSSLRS